MKTLNEFFLEQGYRLYMCSLDQRYMSFVQEENYSVNIVCFFDERKQTSTQAQMQAFEEVHRGRLDYGRGKDIHFLRLICTDAIGVGSLVPGADGHGLEEEEDNRDTGWINRVWYLIDDANPDPDTGTPLGVRLFIPPEAAEDFYGLRRHLEDHVEQNGVSVHIPELNLDEAKLTRNDMDKAPAEQGPDGMPRIHEKEAEKPREIHWVTTGLLLVNALMYILSSLKVFDAYEYGLCLESLRDPSMWYTLLTYMFLHSSVSHLAGNMLMLYAAGSMMEEKMHRAAYLVLYFFCAIAGGVLSVWSQMRIGEEYSSIGASGAIYGIMGALIAWMLMHRQWRSIRYYNRILIAMLLLFYGSSLEEGIDYMAHLGGFVAGLLFTGVYILLTWNKDKRKGGTT
ncbi:MAG: rhomboid family intramembrane serine protease [Lachnospiraceae bacterium]|nr:rhomboid family intramembrane serine protease [Lachnospiraceae bacterium]